MLGANSTAVGASLKKSRDIKAELLQSVVEVATNVADSVDEAMEDLRGLRETQGGRITKHRDGSPQIRSTKCD